MIVFSKPEDGLSHLGATTLDELHEFATSIGIKRSLFKDMPNNPHYDLVGTMADRARQRGAVEMTRKEFLKFLKNNYR